MMASRLPLLGGVLLLVSLQWGCASNAPRASSAIAGSAGSPINAPRSDRGNPPFYEVFGRRYYVLASSEGYRERGVASWYGRDFHGLSTSSGETYNMHAMTAAHKTLPIPTWVEVTNLDNGKSIIVKVNDRGPFVDNRIIDLSYAAAIKLDMVRNGTTRVEVRALGVPAAEPPPVVVAANTEPVPDTAPVPPAIQSVPVLLPPPVTAANPSPAPQLFVQVGAFGDRANAVRLVDRLKANGFVNPFVVTEDDARRTLHRVRLGPLRDSREFDQVSARLRTLGVGDSRLVTAR